MKTKKIKLLARFLLLLPLCAALLGAGCEKEREFDPKNKLLGSWVEQQPCTDGICDTIVFDENGTIKLYEPIKGWTYSFPSPDTIEFTNTSKSLTKNCHFIFNDENEITIFNFYDRTITSQVKNITFTKLD
jgi:hypothetical protein